MATTYPEIFAALAAPFHKEARLYPYVSIPTFPGYLLGANGVVLSQWVRGRWKKRRTKWRRLLTPPDNHGYAQVNLYRVHEGTRHHFKVHILMTTVFFGLRTERMETRHLDGNRMNPSIDNLCYGTSLENSADQIRHGMTNRGTKCHASKLDEGRVLEIVRRRLSGERTGVLAREFGISAPSVSDIMTGRTWGHLTGISR